MSYVLKHNLCLWTRRLAPPSVQCHAKGPRWSIPCVATIWVQCTVKNGPSPHDRVVTPLARSSKSIGSRRAQFATFAIRAASRPNFSPDLKRKASRETPKSHSAPQVKDDSDGRSLRQRHRVAPRTVPEDQVIATQTPPKQGANSARERPSWREYDPAGGLPLSDGDLSGSELQNIFKEPIDADTGNWILRLVNYRRQSGALIDQGIDFSPDLGISRDQAFKALRYLRDVDADFDENKAGSEWAEAQIEEISSEYVQRAEDLGLFKKTTGDRQSVGEDSGPSTMNVYGESELVNMKREAEARSTEEERQRLEREQQAQEAELEAAKAAAKAAAVQPSDTSSPAQDAPASSDTAIATDPITSKASLARTTRAPWVKRYEAQATLSTDPDAPTLSSTSRILPSALLTLLVLGACYLLHENYVPPPTSARSFPDVPPSIATLAALTGTTFALFLAYRLPPLWRTFNKFFVQVPGSPAASSVVLATFTHQRFSHWFVQSVLLFAFGRFLHEDVGRGTFLAIFLAAGTMGNLGGLVYHVTKRQWGYYLFGSSNAVYGIIAATCLLRGAEETVRIGEDEVPLTIGVLFLAALVGIEGWMFLKRPKVAEGVALEGHFVGLATGAGCAAGLRWEAARRRRLEAQEGT